MDNLLNLCGSAMLPPTLRSMMPLAIGAVMLLGVSEASAQTKINMATAQGNCVAVVSDPAGVTLANNGTTDLQANGVILTATPANACTPTGGASANFAANVQISGSSTPGTPYSPAVGSPFYVIWSTSADATVCTRSGGSATGLTGWNTLSPACTSAGTCAGSHAEQVNAIAGGPYNFGVTCSNASGYASQAVSLPNPTTPAPTPSQFTLTASASATAGTPFQVAWPTISNAASCSGTGTLGGVPQAALGDWTSLTSVASPRSVTVPVTSVGNLVLTLKCWNADQSASAVGTSAPIAVTAPIAGNCPANPVLYGTARTRLLASDITYGAYPSPKRTAMPITEWDNLWGHGSATDGITPWPGVNGSKPVMRQFGQTHYAGIHFKTPLAGQIPLGRNGQFLNPSSPGGPNIIMAISTACGDFSANLPTPGCLVDRQYGEQSPLGIPSADVNTVYWKFGTTTNPNGVCLLQPNTDYYMNIIFADPTSTKNCTGTVCPVGELLNFQ